MGNSTGILRLATISVVASFLMLAVVPGMTQAQPLGAGVIKLKCSTTGTFITPDEADPLTAASVTSAVGNCSAGLGTVSSFGVLVGTGFDDTHCVTFASATADSGEKPSPSIIFNKFGDSILIEIKDGVQCFFDANGDEVVLTSGIGFCEITDASDPENPVLNPLSIHFSESEADFVVISEPNISRFQSTGKFDNATGSGTTTSEASHCDRGFPLANYFESTLEGTITIP